MVIIKKETDTLRDYIEKKLKDLNTIVTKNDLMFIY